MRLDCSATAAVRHQDASPLRHASAPSSHAVCRQTAAEPASVVPLLSCTCLCCTHVHSLLLLFLLICWIRARPGLVAPHLHKPEPRASLACSHFTGSAPATSRSSRVRSAPRCCPRADPRQAATPPPPNARSAFAPAAPAARSRRQLGARSRRSLGPPSAQRRLDPLCSTCSRAARRHFRPSPAPPNLRRPRARTSPAEPRGGEREGGGDKDGGQGERHRRWKQKKAPERREIEEKENLNSLKDLCANLENCRDLSVKYKFLINLKP
jgi:hypothetical protein